MNVIRLPERFFDVVTRVLREPHPHDAAGEKLDVTLCQVTKDLNIFERGGAHIAGEVERFALDAGLPPSRDKAPKRTSSTSTQGRGFFPFPNPRIRVSFTFSPNAGWSPVPSARAEHDAGPENHDGKLV